MKRSYKVLNYLIKKKNKKAITSNLYKSNSAIFLYSKCGFCEDKHYQFSHKTNKII